MTSLQTTLLILAATFIVIVLVYNFVQARNASKRVERSRQGMADSAGGAGAQAKHSEGPTSLGAGFGEVATKAGPKIDLSSAAQASLNPQQGQVLERFNLPSIERAASMPGSDSHSDLGAAAQSIEPKNVDPASAENLNQKAPFNPAAVNPELAGQGGATQYKQPKADAGNKVPNPSAAAGAPAGDAWMLRTFGLHPKADCIVQWQLPEAISGEKLLSITNGFRRVGSKPVMFEGQNSQLDPNDAWEPLVAGERFDSLRMGVLMANRHGALNAMEFSDFAAFAEKLAAQFQVHIELPDMQQTLQRARALDAQCAELDAQVALNVIAAESLTVEDLASIALELGLTERGNNRYAMLGEHGEVLYSLALGDAPNRLTLLLDVPRSFGSANPWPRMVDTAKRCAARFAGRLVDDFDKALDKDAIERIGVQLTQRYQSLSDASLEAGSPVALRLFN